MDNTNKMPYVKPEISKIEIDNEISVVLMSQPEAPTADPGNFIPVGQGSAGDNNGNVNGAF